MNIKILGSGCPSCLTLEDNANKAVQELGLSGVEVEHVSDIAEITNYGVMSTPAIIIEGVIKSSGRVPDINEIKDWIK